MELLNSRELAERMKFSEERIRVMCRRKEIPFVKIGGEYRFDWEVIQAWIRGRIIEDSGFAPAEPPRRGRPPKAKEPKPEE